MYLIKCSECFYRTLFPFCSCTRMNLVTVSMLCYWHLFYDVYFFTFVFIRFCFNVKRPRIHIGPICKSIIIIILIIIIITRKGFLRKNIVAVLISRIFSLKINKLPIFSESLCLYGQMSSHNEFQLHIMF